MDHNKRRQASSEHARNIDAIYSRRLPELLGLARKYGYPTDLAMEIIHEAISRVLEVEHPADIEELDRYIVTAVRNRVFDALRKRNRRRPKEPLLYHRAKLNDQPPSPESEYLDAHIRPLIEALEDMPARWRRAIELLIQGRDKRAVARATKLSLRTLNKEVLRKIVALAKSLRNHRRGGK